MNITDVLCDVLRRHDNVSIFNMANMQTFATKHIVHNYDTDIILYLQSLEKSECEGIQLQYLASLERNP